MSTTEDPPMPPESLPKYLSEGLPKQDAETLQATKAWIDKLIEHQTRLVTADNLPNEAEPLEDNSTDEGTLVKERVKCGSDCTCNGGNGHGPYLYRYFRESGKLKSEYVGKA